uniref:Enhancer of mRNA-decapping protein 4 WD40 repeat region domain-containing protein n=1 Tax=Setaria digitata TaxID=48799 RepID=A0A915PTM0_9BILA
MTGEQLLSSHFNEVSPPSSILEKHVLNGSDAVVRFSGGTHIVLSVDGQEDKRPRDRDSSRVYTHVLSEYKWASEECYNGRILAVHENLIAYRLFNESTGEAVRVLERTTSKRHLIKSFKHPTADLQWAHHAPLLAVIDVNANLYAYHVDKDCVVTKYLNIIREDNSVPLNATPRISWCPYIPEADEPHEEMHMIAIYYRNAVESFSLSIIKSELHCEEVTLEQCEKISDAVMKLPIENSNAQPFEQLQFPLYIIQEVQAVCLSPDATAIAVALNCGTVTFFIIDGEGTKFAHRWQPEHGRHIQDLVFLDNITASDTPEQFWKYAVISTENGKRIQLYDTENWHCIARLLFEPLDQLGKLALSVHPSAKFIFLTDYDAANIYCIEVAYIMSAPRFVACTQVTFCHPLVNIVPISVTHQEDPHQDFSLSDEEVSPAGVLVSFVALSQRSLLHLEVGLEKSHISNGDAIGAVGDEDNSEQMISASSANIADDGNVVPNGEKRQRKPEDLDRLDALYRHWEGLSLSLEKQSEDFEKRLQEERDRTDEQMRQLREDIVSCDERLFLKLESLINENRTSTVEAMQTSLDLKMDSVIQNLRATTIDNFKQQHQQQSLDVHVIREELTNNIREMLMATMIPILQDVCVSLFQQLNENFRAGLEQYMKQMHTLCASTLRNQAANDSLMASNSSSTDPSALINLIENQRITAAFEKALMLKDFGALMFVCNNVDPDVIAAVERPLPQNVLLCLLNQLSTKLEGETDLKFRYIENVLMVLQVRDPSIAASFRHVLNRLQTSLTAYMGTDTNASLKRRARIISQLAANLLK